MENNFCGQLYLKNRGISAALEAEKRKREVLGKWSPLSLTLLANYGFKQGDEFKVTCLEEGKIVLEIISN